MNQGNPYVPKSGPLFYGREQLVGELLQDEQAGKSLVVHAFDSCSSEDLCALELMRSVFQTVSQNRYDHLAGSVRFRRFIEPFTNRIDRATNGVQECCRPVRNMTMII